MLKAILFDLGDTLLDFAPMDTRAVFEMAGRKSYAYLAARGVPLPPFGRYYRSQYWAVRWSYLWSLVRRREFNCYHLLQRMCAKMGIALGEPDMRELAWQWYSPLTEYCTVAADVVPTLARLRDRGLKLAIVSNTFIPGFVLDRHMGLHGLLEHFPVRIYSSATGYRKPHPRIFQTALDALGVRAGHAAFVGDLVKADIVGARRLGMVSVLRQPSADSRTHPVADHVIRRLTDLQQILPLLDASPARPLPDGDLACEA